MMALVMSHQVYAKTKTVYVTNETYKKISVSINPEGIGGWSCPKQKEDVPFPPAVLKLDTNCNTTLYMEFFDAHDDRFFHIYVHENPSHFVIKNKDNTHYEVWMDGNRVH